MAYGIVSPKNDTPRVYLSTVNEAIKAESTSELDLLLEAIKEAFEGKGKFLVLRDEPTETFRCIDQDGDLDKFVQLCLDKREAGKLIVWGED